MIRSVLPLAAALLTLVAGCSTTKTVDVSKLPAPPGTAELVEAHNTWVGTIETLWARVSVRARGAYSDGSTYEEQGEGHLQIVRPDRISLSIGKLGETYFVFGASASAYWSFDLFDSERKLLITGQMDRVTRDKAAALGLPVHPGEIIELSGLSTIDLARAGGTRWREDGKAFGFSAPSRWGTMTTWFDPSSRLVVQTQAFDAQGQLIASADLSRFKPADGPIPVQVPGKIEITTPADDGFVRIELSGPRQREIRPMVFQPDRLRRSYRVDEVIDLDELATEPAEGEPVPDPEPAP